MKVAVYTDQKRGVQLICFNLALLYSFCFFQGRSTFQVSIRTRSDTLPTTISVLMGNKKGGDWFCIPSFFTPLLPLSEATSLSEVSLFQKNPLDLL